MQLRTLLALSVLLLYTSESLANEKIHDKVPNASVVGRGNLSYAFWDIYEATLYAPEGRFDYQKPFALSIEYFHAIDGKDIADESVQEMRRQGFDDEVKLAAWYAQMKSIFPDVEDRTVLSAIFTPGLQTTFYNGTKPIGSIKGDDFGKVFFDIWLGEKTSEPELRRALLGQL